MNDENKRKEIIQSNLENDVIIFPNELGWELIRKKEFLGFEKKTRFDKFDTYFESKIVYEKIEVSNENTMKGFQEQLLLLSIKFPELFQDSKMYLENPKILILL